MSPHVGAEVAGLVEALPALRAHEVSRAGLRPGRPCAAVAGVGERKTRLVRLTRRDRTCPRAPGDAVGLPPGSAGGPGTRTAVSERRSQRIEALPVTRPRHARAAPTCAGSEWLDARPAVAGPVSGTAGRSSGTAWPHRAQGHGASRAEPPTATHQALAVAPTLSHGAKRQPPGTSPTQCTGLTCLLLTRSASPESGRRRRGPVCPPLAPGLRGEGRASRAAPPPSRPPETGGSTVTPLSERTRNTTPRRRGRGLDARGVLAGPGAGDPSPTSEGKAHTGDRGPRLSGSSLP